jgi:hypothetical protein
LFSTKLGILKALIDQSIAGDDAPVAVAARPDVAPLFEEADPLALLGGFAGVPTSLNERTNDLHRVLVSAAESDPAAAELLAEIRDQRGRGQRQIVRTLSKRKLLQSGLSARDAEDRVHALMSPEVYRLFVVDRAWTPEQYREWLASTLAQQLL